MDYRLRKLQREALLGGPESLARYEVARRRAGLVPPARPLLHGWEEQAEFPAESHLDNLVYYLDEETGTYIIEVDGESIPTEITTEAKVIKEIKESLHACNYCLSDIENKCCHCSLDLGSDRPGSAPRPNEDFERCLVCEKDLCTTDPCVRCLRLTYERFPISVDGKVVEWHFPHGYGSVCGICATGIRDSEDIRPYYAILHDYEDGYSQTYLFRCDNCRQYIKPKRTNPSSPIW